MKGEGGWKTGSNPLTWLELVLFNAALALAFGQEPLHGVTHDLAGGQELQGGAPDLRLQQVGSNERAEDSEGVDEEVWAVERSEGAGVHGEGGDSEVYYRVACFVQPCLYTRDSRARVFNKTNHSSRQDACRGA